MNKAIRYLRYSSDGQSQHSIERQEQVTAQWLQFNKVELTDTFIDEGYSARNFDRPDIKQLFDFIKKNHRSINYLVVAELSRFSREAGDAITMVKKIQSTYGINIVSAARGTVYDVYDSNSFMMMGIEFLLGNSENIKRTNDINGGIYTAKAVKGKWIQGGAAPFGYTKEGSGDNRRLVVNEAEAVMVRMIFRSYLNGTPIYRIREEVKALGFRKTGNDAITEILKNPLYMGYQYVKPWKNLPGGLYPLKNFTPLVSEQDWKKVQDLLKPGKPKQLVNDSFPLRGVLKCHCGRCLTGASSRGRHGVYFPYYKCQVSGHNNINATKAHAQLEQVLQHMSLPQRLIDAIRRQSEQLLQQRLQEQQQLLLKHESDLKRVQQNLMNVEEKWITNQLNLESYQRWFDTYNRERIVLSGTIKQLKREFNQASVLLDANLEPLKDLRYLYVNAATVQKQELLRRVFDNRLYYANGLYRTPYLMPVFKHNELILKQNQLLELDAVRGEDGSGGGHQSTIEPLFSLLEFIASIQAA